MDKYYLLGIFILVTILVVPINLLFDKFVINYHEGGHLTACEEKNISCEEVSFSLSSSKISNLNLWKIFTSIPYDYGVEVRPNITEFCSLTKTERQEIRLAGIRNDFKVVMWLVVLSLIVNFSLLILWISGYNEKYKWATCTSIVLNLISITLTFMLIKQLLQINYHLSIDTGDLYFFVCP
ncbi:MAG: hypothetical protein Q8R00_03910 [Candidatus Nanoarchaeia archaeon]|nr:hypothetical protein [Candidatus Nanoarchaeia archaeon]